MFTFIFRNNAGNLVIVRAKNEDDARRFAMTELWGPASYSGANIGCGRWTGSGLDLIAVNA